MTNSYPSPKGNSHNYCPTKLGELVEESLYGKKASPIEIEDKTSSSSSSSDEGGNSKSLVTTVKLTEKTDTKNIVVLSDVDPEAKSIVSLLAKIASSAADAAAAAATAASAVALLVGTPKTEEPEGPTNLKEAMRREVEGVVSCATEAALAIDEAALSLVGQLKNPTLEEPKSEKEEPKTDANDTTVDNGEFKPPARELSNSSIAGKLSQAIEEALGVLVKYPPLVNRENAMNEESSSEASALSSSSSSGFFESVINRAILNDPTTSFSPSGRREAIIQSATAQTHEPTISLTSASTSISIPTPTPTQTPTPTPASAATSVTTTKPLRESATRVTPVLPAAMKRSTLIIPGTRLATTTKEEGIFCPVEHWDGAKANEQEKIVEQKVKEDDVPAEMKASVFQPPRRPRLLYAIPKKQPVVDAVTSTTDVNATPDGEVQTESMIQRKRATIIISPTPVDESCELESKMAPLAMLEAILGTSLQERSA